MIKGMFNRYCGTLFIIMASLLVTGMIMGLRNNVQGLIPFTLGGLLSLGFKILKDSPREVGVISVFGVKKECQVEGLVLLFKPFGYSIIDVVVIGARQVDVEFPLEQINCKEKGVVSGKVSVSIRPKSSSAADLIQFDDAGQLEGIKSQLDEMFVASVQRIAQVRSATYMVTESLKIGRDLKAIIEGKESTHGIDRTNIDDIRGLGIDITKLQVKLYKDKLVIAAEQQTLVTDTINERIDKRIQFLRKNGLKTRDINPELVENVRKQLIEEDMNAGGRIQEVRGGGRNVNVNQTGKGGNNP